MNTMQENEIDEVKKTYPTEVDENGFFYEDEGFEALGILTKEDNGNKVCKCTLSDGRTAIVRELTGAESKKAKATLGKSMNMLEAAYAALATKIDGKEYPYQELLNMKAKDYNKIETASSILNFL
jgi:hypothetical protein